MKKFLSFQKEFNESSAYGRISSRFKTLSGRSLDSAAKEHGDEAKKLQKEIEAQQKEIDRRKAAMKQEEVHISEATVKTQKYSWGTMKTVHHGSDFSIPLHPEHHKAIAKLKDEQEHSFKDETGRHWTARRKGEEVHFQGANNGGSTKVKHSDLKEEVEQVEEKMDMAKAKMGDVIKDFQKSDAPQFAGKSKEKRREMAIAAKLGAEREMKEDTNKDGRTMIKFKDIAEQLKGKQHKLDADKDGKIEGEDLAKLRSMKKEETEQIDELKKSTLASYVMKAADSAKSKKDAAANMYRFTKQVTPAMKKSAEGDKRIEGIKSATKRLAKEEVEEIEELNKSTIASYAKKASKDARIKSMVAKDMEHRSETSRKDSNKTSFSNLATDWKKKAWKREAGVNKAVDRLTKEEVAKATGDLKDACWKGYTAVGMKMKNGRKVPNCVPTKEEKKPDLPFTPDNKDNFKKPNNPNRTPMDTARALAQKGMKQKIKEKFDLDISDEQADSLLEVLNGEVDRLDEISTDAIVKYARKADDEVSSLKKHIKSGGEYSDIAKNVLKKRESGLNRAGNKLMKRAMVQDYKDSSAKKRLTDEVEFDNEGNYMANPVSFSDFIANLQEIKMSDLPSRKVTGRGYGTEYYKKEAEKDKDGYDDKPEKSTEKRGRGRPSGSKSGARQKGSTTGKKKGGVEMTGYPLHLPNKN